MTDHELKIIPRFFTDVARFAKRYEVRKNDRDFKEGDHIVLREWDGTDYTGRQILGYIDYVLTAEDFPEGIKEGYCVFAYNVRPYGVQDWREDE